MHSAAEHITQRGIGKLMPRRRLMEQSRKNKKENENRVNTELVKRSATAKVPAPQTHRVTAAGWSPPTPTSCGWFGQPCDTNPINSPLGQTKDIFPLKEKKVSKCLGRGWRGYPEAKRKLPLSPTCSDHLLQLTGK